MPFALIMAFAVSLGIHAAALFGPEFDLSTEPEAPTIVAELRPLPPPQPRVDAVARAEKPAKARAPRRKVEPAASAMPAPTLPEETPAPEPPELPPAAAQELPPAPPSAEPPATAQPPELAPAEPRLPPRGMIRYRVDRGDSNFEIGYAQHEWEIVDGRYRLQSVVETTGLVRLFKSLRIEMESRGTISDQGLRPETFVIRRNGKEVGEQATFDWVGMKVRVGDRAEQALAYGAQDLLSFNYQLGFLPDLGAGSVLPIATGKKYGVYRLEVIGDEEIEVPAGTLRTLHLRAPGENTTELWLAYDYLLLPVKIRHVDVKGDSFVQVATQIQLSPP
jgi:hypothetical protein